jgi:2-dehydro-3-deoxygluconokinase
MIPGRPIRKIALLGEALIELRADADSEMTTSFGGDVANAAVGLVRLCGPTETSVHLVTALGDSAYSQWLRARLRREQVLLREPQDYCGEPGIYGVPFGTGTSMHFSYWRDQSAAKQFMQQITAEQLDALLEDIDVLVVTGITLALCSDSSFGQLMSWVGANRKRCGIIFDCNYRPRLWADRKSARGRIGQFGAMARLLATGLEDEAALWDLKEISDIVDRIQGIDGEYVVRAGAGGCWIGYERTYQRVSTREVNVADAAGAGDAHLAAYLAARLIDCEPREAADYANRVAALIVSQRGSVPAVDLRFPPLPVPRNTLAEGAC